MGLPTPEARISNGRIPVPIFAGLNTRISPFGTAGRRIYGKVGLGQTVTVIQEDIDRYGRIVATVILPDGRNLNYEILAAGSAWWYRKYAADDEGLRKLEGKTRRLQECDDRGIAHRIEVQSLTGTCALRMRFSAARYSLRNNNPRLTRPVQKTTAGLASEIMPSEIDRAS